MSLRKLVRGFAVVTVQYGKVFETQVINGNCITIRSQVDFTEKDARATNFKFCAMLR